MNTILEVILIWFVIIFALIGLGVTVLVALKLCCDTLFDGED